MNIYSSSDGNYDALKVTAIKQNSERIDQTEIKNSNRLSLDGLSVLTIH